MPPPLLAARFPVLDSAGWQLRAEASCFEASDATPVRGLQGDWARYSPRAGGNVALQQASVSVAAQRAGWELAATVRSEFVVRGSRGAFDAVHAYKQREAPADGSVLAVDAQAQGLVWAGLRGARTWALQAGPATALQFSAAVTLLQPRRVRLTDVSGGVAYRAATGYAFDARTREQDSQARVAGYGDAGTRGSGYSADLALLWQPEPDSFVNLSVVDALSRVRVPRVFTEATTLSSATRRTDADGYLDYRPLATGRDSSQTVALRLAPKWSLSAGTRFGSAAGDALSGAVAGVRWERVSGVDLPAVWATLPWHRGPLAGWHLQADADLRFASIGLGLTGPHGALMLRSSHADPTRAHALGWQASLHWPL